MFITHPYLPEVTCYNLFQIAVLTSLTLPQETYGPGSPPCKNGFLAQMKESMAGRDSRKYSRNSKEMGAVEAELLKSSEQLCAKFELIVPGPSLQFPLQDRTPQALLPPFLLHPHFPMTIPE